MQIGERSAAGAVTESGISENIEEVWKNENSRLSGRLYADQAGAALYSELQLTHVFQELRTSLYSNPHSRHGGSQEIQQAARRLTLKLCNASEAEYECVFTSGTTGGIKLIAEAFPWTKNSCFAYTEDNHTSIVGIREPAMRAGASMKTVRTSYDAGTWIVTPKGEARYDICDKSEACAVETHSLFAYPLESNFSGARYDHHLAGLVKNWGLESGSFQNGRHDNWWVLLDAAKACSAHPPDLSDSRADFVVFSFYKIFGYPSGLGALLIHKKATSILKRSYFGGGTVLACSANTSFVKRKEGPVGLEDGTASFLGITSLRHGFALIDRLGGFPAIELHAQHIARSFAEQLTHLRHFNHTRVCTIYGWGDLSQTRPSGPTCSSGQGPTVTFNLLRSDGTFVGYREVERVAGLNGILLRGGCFCNPGACAAMLQLSDQGIYDELEPGRVCWDDDDLVNGQPTGAVRVSFGYASARRHIAELLEFVSSNFVEQCPSEAIPGARTLPTGASNRRLCISAIWVYPIKSCAGFKPDKEWSLGHNGLLYDREWALVGEDSKALTLASVPELARIRPIIRLETGIMEVTAPGMSTTLVMHLEDSHSPVSRPEEKCIPSPKGLRRHVQICANSTWGIQEEASPDHAPSRWFSKALNRPCHLVRQAHGARHATSRSMAQAASLACSGDMQDSSPPSLGFANEGQILLISEASVADLQQRLGKDHASKGLQNSDAIASRFRPNLIVSGLLPSFEEDCWRQIAIGETIFETAGSCARCEVVCINTTDGRREGSEPLRTLASYRRQHGRINFGIFLHVSHKWPGLSLAPGLPLRVLQIAQDSCEE